MRDRSNYGCMLFFSPPINFTGFKLRTSGPSSITIQPRLLIASFMTSNDPTNLTAIAYTMSMQIVNRLVTTLVLSFFQGFQKIKIAINVCSLELTFVLLTY